MSFTVVYKTNTTSESVRCLKGSLSAVIVSKQKQCRAFQFLYPHLAYSALVVGVVVDGRHRVSGVGLREVRSTALRAMSDLLYAGVAFRPDVLLGG